MPVAEKAQGGRATVQRRPFCPPRPGGGGAENEPPHPSAADAPQGADPGPSPGPAPPSEPNGSPAAGPPRPLLPSGGAARSGTLQVVLCNYSLWLAFHGQQNEMMLKRPGRAMFPFLAYQIRGLEPRARYRVFVDMVRVDGQHWRYEKARWAPYEPEESHVPDNQVYPHPDSPNTGAHWMQREVAFKTLRLTNAQPAARSAGRAIWLQSQHRYRPRLHVQELGGGDREAPAAASRTHVFSFPETEFIAVTAYRNAEIIRLKIAHNPYAKAFRRRSAAAGSSSAGPPPPPAAALPPSLLPPTSAAAAPHPDRREPPGCGAREQPRLHRKMCSRGTQTDAQDAAGEERAPKKRRLSPGPSGSRAVSSARAHGQAQAQPLPAPEGSMNASPEAAAEDPGDLPVTEEAAVQEGDRAMPANCWALQQPQQPQQPLYYVFDSTPSSSSSSSSNDQATLEVVTLDLQTSPTPLEAIYGSNPENWLALLQAAIFPADPSQGTSGDCDPSLPLQPVPGAQEQLSVQEQIWPHLTQTELEDSAQAEGAPQKRGLSPQASGSQARCSEGADEEARDQLLTAAASSPYTFPEAISQDPGQASVPDSAKGIPVLSSAPRQSQPPLHPLFQATPSSSNSSGLETLQVETLNPGLQTSPAPLAASYDSGEESPFALLESLIFPSESSQGTSGDCHPSLPLQPVPGVQEEPSVQEQIWPHLTQTELGDSAQAEGAPQKRGLSPWVSGSQARCSGRDDGEARDQLLTAAASSPYTFPEATSQDPGQASVPDSRKGIPVLSSAPQQSQPPLHPLFQATPSSSNSSGLETLQVETLNPSLQTSPAPLAASYDSDQESLFALLESLTLPSESSQGTSGDCQPSLPLYPVPGAQEEPSVQEQIWPQLTQTELGDSAAAERAPKKRRLSPPASGRQGRFSGGGHGEAQDQLLTAAASSPYTFSGAASEDPGQTSVPDSRKGIPVLSSAPQQSQPPLHPLFQATPSSINSSGLETLQVETLNPGLQTSPAPLAASYDSGEESLFALLESLTFPSESSQGTSGDCQPSLPLQPVPGVQEEPSVQKQIWPHLTQTELGDSAQAEGAPQKRGLSPPASGRQGRFSGGGHGEAQDQLLTAAASSPYTFSGATSQDPGQASVPDSRKGIPVLSSAPQQSQPPLHPLFQATPSSSNSSGLETLQVETLNPGLQTSPAPLAASYDSDQESLFALLESLTLPSESSQGTSGDCQPSLPLQPVPGVQEEPSVQEQIWPHLTQTELGDSAQAEGAPQKRGLSPWVSGSQARCSGRDGGEAQDQLLTTAACSPFTFPEAASEDPGHLLGVQEAPAPNNSSGLPVLSSAPRQSQQPLHSLFQATPSSSNSRSLPGSEDVAMGPSTSPLAMPCEPSAEEALISIMEACRRLLETSQGTSSDCLSSVPSKPVNPIPGAQEGQSLQQEIWPSLTETVSKDSPQAPRTSETAPLSHKDSSGQGSPFIIPDFSWDSLF